MAVPGHDQRDLEFAQAFSLPVRAVVEPTDEWLHKMQDSLKSAQPIALSIESYAKQIGNLPEAFVDDGVGMQSANPGVSLDGLPTPQAKARMTEWLVNRGIGRGAISISCVTGSSADSATGASPFQFCMSWMLKEIRRG